MIIRTLMDWWQSLRYYVIADPADNSVTLSKHLFRHIRNNASEDADTGVFVFYVPETRSYGFMAEHGIRQPTQICRIQYNGKYKCIGFETLCPSVGRIMFDYGIPALSRPVKLSVSVRETAKGKIFYQINRPTCKAFSGIQGKRT